MHALRAQVVSIQASTTDGLPELQISILGSKEEGDRVSALPQLADPRDLTYFSDYLLSEPVGFMRFPGQSFLTKSEHGPNITFLAVLQPVTFPSASPEPSEEINVKSQILNAGGCPRNQNSFYRFRDVGVRPQVRVFGPGRGRSAHGQAQGLRSVRESRFPTAQEARNIRAIAGCFYQGRTPSGLEQLASEARSTSFATTRTQG